MINTTLQAMKKQQVVPAIGAMLLPMSELYSVAMQSPPLMMAQSIPQITFTPNAQLAYAEQASLSDFPTMHIFIAVFNNQNELQPTSLQYLEKRKKWRIREYRHAYMDAAVEQGVAWQIKINRERRNLTQTQLAEGIGSKQSCISRSEDPSYGHHNLETLKKIAHVFDCALQVKFIPYSQLAKDSHDLSPVALYAKSYIEESEPCQNETVQPKSLPQPSMQ